MTEENNQEEYINEAETESVILNNIINEDLNVVENFQLILNEDLPDNEEVLKLTQYDGGLGVNNTFSVAEYHDINIHNVELKHQKLAKNFVSKIKNFIFDFKDVELSVSQKDYLETVASLQLDNLTDLLYLVDINKQILYNIVRRINSVQSEDYAMVATYNNLINQHLKLIKELQSTYKNIPAVLKKMRTEVICNQELGDTDIKEEVIESDSGNTQFNNTRELLKKIRVENENKKN